MKASPSSSLNSDSIHPTGVPPGGRGCTKERFSTNLGQSNQMNTDLKLNHKSLILLTRFWSRKWLSFFVNDPPGAGAGLI